MSTRKIGGIYFITVGPVGFALWYRRRWLQTLRANATLWWLSTGDRWSRMLVP